jgi:toxin ParE1/3/4
MTASRKAVSYCGIIPNSAPPVLRFAEEARALIIERWIALYRLVEDGVRVVRIVDGARDLTRIDWTPE